MIGYMTIGSDDLARSCAFYDALLPEIGGKRALEMPGHAQFYAFAKGAMLGVFLPNDGKPHHRGNGQMVALNVGSTDKVKSFHARALELGGSDEGQPGHRTPNFYGAYFRDLDGNKLCAYTLTS